MRAREGTEALLAASLFCFRGQTWPGVLRRVRGPPAATFRTQQGLFASSPLPPSGIAPRPRPIPSTAPKATSLVPLPKPIISKLHYPTEVPRLGWRKGGGDGALWGTSYRTGVCFGKFGGFPVPYKLLSPWAPFSPISPPLGFPSFQF